ncbi:hypothetical protein SAMN05216464_11610 [Mucilaginibacter pineti]|uniref:Uncharacterized protein n=1 Tax=Mucilaginibacter pineti TaxID=1391627 RepID=A0A1G7K660_9SPHI|nr:hypothetical protein [Mucilaginibacter pineti]SDF32713.1 hypothetical protein SAMN05216464_11610 [Mucilaginibacter pineti]
MKKILTLVCCTILLAATSCTKKYVSPATTNRTIIYDKAASDWKAGTSENLGTYYYLDISGGDLPELDGPFQQFGAVLVYMSFDGGKTYEAVPETIGGYAYSFQHSVRNITIFSQSPNEATAKNPDVDVTIKVVLIDSNDAS